MFKMPYPRNHHRQLVFHTIVDGILVTDGTTRLDKGRDTRRMGYLHAVIEWEECTRAAHQQVIHRNV